MQEQHLSDFDFELPPELIAQYPLENRTASRLLHITKDVIEDCTFTDIEGFLHEGDLLVANNTKVIKARLLGRKATGGNVEALIERVTGERTAISMVRASKSPKPGTVLYFEADGIEEPVMVTGRQGQFFELEFERPVLDVLEAFGRGLCPLSRRRGRSNGRPSLHRGSSRQACGQGGRHRVCHASRRRGDLSARSRRESF